MKKMKTNKELNAKVLAVIANNYDMLYNKYVTKCNNYEGQTDEDIFCSTILDLVEHSEPRNEEEILKLFELRFNVINYRTIMGCKHHTRLDDVLNYELNNNEDANDF